DAATQRRSASLPAPSQGLRCLSARSPDSLFAHSSAQDIYIASSFRTAEFAVNLFLTMRSDWWQACEQQRIRLKLRKFHRLTALLHSFNTSGPTLRAEKLRLKAGKADDTVW